MIADADSQPHELVALIRRHADGDGVHATAIPALTLVRRSRVTEPRHGMYKPSLCIVAQGAKGLVGAGAIPVLLPGLGRKKARSEPCLSVIWNQLCWMR